MKEKGYFSTLAAGDAPASTLNLSSGVGELAYDLVLRNWLTVSCLEVGRLSLKLQLTYELTVLACLPSPNNPFFLSWRHWSPERPRQSYCSDARHMLYNLVSWWRTTNVALHTGVKIWNRYCSIPAGPQNASCVERHLKAPKNNYRGRTVDHICSCRE